MNWSYATIDDFLEDMMESVRSKPQQECEIEQEAAA